jgi:hypothetical protein
MNVVRDWYQWLTLLKMHCIYWVKFLTGYESVKFLNTDLLFGFIQIVEYSHSKLTHHRNLRVMFISVIIVDLHCFLTLCSKCRRMIVVTVSLTATQIFFPFRRIRKVAKLLLAY